MLPQNDRKRRAQGDRSGCHCGLSFCYCEPLRFPCHSESFTSCHSERSEESLPLDPSPSAQGDKGGCHSERSEESLPLDPSPSAQGDKGGCHFEPFTPCHSERSEESNPAQGKLREESHSAQGRLRVATSVAEHSWRLLQRVPSLCS